MLKNDYKDRFMGQVMSILGEMGSLKHLREKVVFFVTVNLGMILKRKTT